MPGMRCTLIDRPGSCAPAMSVEGCHTQRQEAIPKRKRLGVEIHFFFFFIDYFRVRKVGSICYEKDEK